jgi:HlyD family secretion protein
VRPLLGKKKIRIIILLSIIVSSSSFYVYKSINASKPNEYIYYGTVEADELNISSEISGKITGVKVQEGNKVKPGELIATIGSDEDLLKTQNAEVAIKNAENDLGKVEDGNRIEQIRSQQAVVGQAKALVQQGEAAVKTAKNNVNIAQINFNYKKKNYDDSAVLYQNGAESKYTMDADKNELDNAQSTLNSAKSSLESTQAQINNYKEQLDAATQSLNLLIDGSTERDKNTAKYNIESAQKNYELSKVELDKSNVISTVSGTIETINFKQGEYVTPGSAIATLLDNNDEWVKIYIPESALPSVKLGKEVTLKSDFLKNKTIKGKIIYISPEAEFTPMNIVTKKDRMKLVFEVKVKILDNLESAKPGMLMDVNLK